MVKSLDPQEISDVSVQMRSPTNPGMYQGQWRMCTASGLFYGGREKKNKQDSLHVQFCLCSKNKQIFLVLALLYIAVHDSFFSTDVIWVILSVEVGGLLGVTQQLSCFETEFNTQPQRSVQEDFNPFASPQKNKHDATDNGFGDPEEAWEHTQEPIQQDQNGLSHNAVNRTSNGLQTNLSMVTYGQVCMHK